MTTQRRTVPVRLAAVCRAVLLLTVAVGGGPAAAQEAESPERGIFVAVANPITSEVVNAVRERVARARRDKPVAKFVFEFNLDGKEASSPDYGPCRDLAKEI